MNERRMTKVFDPVQLFSSLSTNDQIRFLARFGWELTIAGRDTYVPQTEALRYPARLRAINEVQHRILAHIYALASSDSRRYPDDVLVAIVLDENGDRELNEQIRHAFDRAAEFLEGNPG
jgi:hypothetical protein